jgi:hypothetical protein
MTLNTRLARLEKGGPRAERASRLLPSCTDHVNAFPLLVNHLPKVCVELLHLTRPEVLASIYEATMQVYGEMR